MDHAKGPVHEGATIAEVAAPLAAPEEAQESQTCHTSASEITGSKLKQQGSGLVASERACHTTKKLCQNIMRYINICCKLLKNTTKNLLTAIIDQAVRTSEKFLEQQPFSLRAASVARITLNPKQKDPGIRALLETVMYDTILYAHRLEYDDIYTHLQGTCHDGHQDQAKPWKEKAAIGHCQAKDPVHTAEPRNVLVVLAVVRHRLA